MTRISRLHLPMLAPVDLKPYLADEAQYRDGRSAKLIAETWFYADGLPPKVKDTLNELPRFADAELVDAFMERRTGLGDRWRPSQSDVLAIIGLPSELAVMAVEGKVDESFGPLVSDWRADASDEKKERLTRLIKTLGLESVDVDKLRYQLLHRTASAIYEAQRYRAKVAIMMVHSFDSANAGIADFRRFAAQLGLTDVGIGRLAGPVARDGVELYLGWTVDLR